MGSIVLKRNEFRKTGFNNFKELVENNNRKEKAKEDQVAEKMSWHVYLGITSENRLQES